MLTTWCQSHGGVRLRGVDTAEFHMTPRDKQAFCHFLLLLLKEWSDKKSILENIFYTVLKLKKLSLKSLLSIIQGYLP